MGAPHFEAPDLVGHIGNVVNHRIGVDQFWRWFVAAMPEIEDKGPDSLVDLAWRVEHRFAEYTSGYIDDGQLIAALRGDLDDAGTLSGVREGIDSPPSGRMGTVAR